MLKKHLSAGLGLMLMVAPILAAQAARPPKPPATANPMSLGGREPVYTQRQVRSTNKCLDVTGSANGSPVVQWDCWGGNNQKWLMEPLRDGYYWVRPWHTDKCLDATGGENGSPVVQWDCWGGDNQKWKREELGDGSYYLRNKHYNKCLDATGSANGSPVVQWDCWGGDNQKWYGGIPKQGDPTAKAIVDGIGVGANFVGTFGSGVKH